MKIIVRDLIDRLKDSLDIKNDSDIAKELGVAQNTLSGAIARNSLKFETFELVHELIFRNNLSSNWIIYGLKEDENLKKSIINDIEKELIDDIKKLSQKRQEYYYHRVKADLIDDEI